MSGTKGSSSLIEQQSAPNDLIAEEAGVQQDVSKEAFSGQAAIERFIAAPSTETLMEIPYIVPIGAIVLLFIIL